MSLSSVQKCSVFDALGIHGRRAAMQGVGAGLRLKLSIEINEKSDNCVCDSQTSGPRRILKDSVPAGSIVCLAAHTRAENYVKM